MTITPAGAQLAPVDPPPPPPHQDPREPPSSTRRPGTHTPHRPQSPNIPGVPSRGASPQRPANSTAMDRTASLDAIVSVPPLLSPSPKRVISPTHSTSLSPTTGASASAIHGHHLSRPSSPSSIHSSTSAIFERDIEHPLNISTVPAHTPGQTLSHKPSRLGFGYAHGSALDHAVPAVLDDAIEALTSSEGMQRGIQGLEIESPAPAGGVGMARVSSNSIPGLPGRGASSPPPLTGLGHSQSSLRSPSGSSSPISIASKSSATSPVQSPPILAQLGTGADKPKSTGDFHIPAPSEIKLPDPTNEPVKEPVKDEPVYPVRPSAPTRMSTGRQVPGGWMSAWTREDDRLMAEMEAHAHPGPGEIGVGLERTAGILGEKEKVVPVEEMPPTAVAAASTQSTSPPSSPSPPTAPPAAIPSHLTSGISEQARRISFISYNDLLLSVPTTVTSLGEITSGQLNPEHIPGTVSPVKARSPRLSMNGPEDGAQGDSLGEWGREGLGRGLEQRLEDLGALGAKA